MTEQSSEIGRRILTLSKRRSWRIQKTLLDFGVPDNGNPVRWLVGRLAVVWHDRLWSCHVARSAPNGDGCPRPATGVDTRPPCAHSGDHQSGEQEQRPMWLRCKCDQYGRCLTDCPSADLPRPSPTAYFDRRRSAWVDRGRGRVTPEPQVIDYGFGAHGQGEATDDC